MKAIFRACGVTEQVDYPSLTKEEIYQEFIEWLLEKADASVDIEAEKENKGGDECEFDESELIEGEFDFESEVIPGMTDGSMGRTWSQDWE